MYQSGFRTNHSTDLCLAQLIDFVAIGMDKQMHTGMKLVDLQKAFDTLDDGVLLKKMKYFGFWALELNDLSPIFQTESFWFVWITFFLRLEH